MMTDPLADFLTRIKNGYMAHKEKIDVSHSKVKESLAKLLSEQGYVGKVDVSKIDKTKSVISIQLLYQNRKPKVEEIIKVSKPGRRTYVNKKSIPKVLSGLGICVISTPLGLMTGKQAAQKGLGGELICKMW